MTLDPSIYSRELEESEEFFQALIRGFRRRAAEARTVFMQTDLERFTSAPEHELLDFLITAYEALAFFPDPEIKSRFLEMGVKPQQLSRFIPIEDVVREINEITADGGLWLPKGRVLFLIKVYLDHQVRQEVARWFQLTAPLNGKPFASKVKAELYKIVRRRRYSGGSPKLFKNELDRRLNHYVDIFVNHVGDEQEAEKLLLDIAGGNTDTMLFKGIRTLARFENKNKYKRRFYNLFKLLAFHHVLLSQREHDLLPRYYGRSFSVYQARRVDQLTR